MPDPGFLCRRKTRHSFFLPKRNRPDFTEKSDNSLFYTTEGIIRSKMTLRDAEALLAEQGFFRTHKGYIVNLSMIYKIETQDNGTLLLTMNHYPKEKVPVSRHYIKDFRTVMHMK